MKKKMISVRVDISLYQKIDRYILEQKLEGLAISKNGFIIEAIEKMLKQKGIENESKNKNE